MTRARTDDSPSRLDTPVEPPGLSRAPTLFPPRRRRRPALLALAVAMVVLGALGASFVATSLGQTTSVVALTRAVPWGQKVTDADLVEARIAADPALSPIPYADRDEVIGMIAATDLTAGSLLTREALTDERFPPPGQHLVGVAVTTAQVPATPLRSGDEVLLVPMATEGMAPAGAPTPGPVQATVANTGPVGVDGLRVVDVLVDDVDGADVAARAAAGLVVIVVVPGE
ncbi:SAF domain-containing protein [Blastococcus colisei]|uniref:SAF domain-containing protein n=1 Tax=Blastococcus colisei TaxID=1564162 RepID=A0A543PJ33_9ACTN|nr:SAF domain-containing protein [Blastococcus colisei]TQN44092.1 SAF domain-containing protein [Blastococcus colisei]